MWFVILLLAESIASLSESGARAMREQRFADAATAYRSLQKQDPANPMWRMNLGLVLHSSGEYEAALAEFDAFLKAKPAPGPIHYMAGVARLKLRHSCEAIPALEKARVWNADRSLVDLADAYQGCRVFEQAGRAYEAAFKRKLGDSRLARQAAHAYWQARMYDEVIRMLRPLERDFASDPDFNFEYGDSLLRTAGSAQGLSYLLRAANAAPDRLAARAEAGKALLAANRAEEAIPHLEAASRVDIALLLPLSRAYRMVGRAADADRAQADYRRLYKP